MGQYGFLFLYFLKKKLTYRLLAAGRLIRKRNVPPNILTAETDCRSWLRAIRFISIILFWRFPLPFLSAAIFTMMTKIPAACRVCVWSWAMHSCANGRSDLDYGYVQAGALSSSKKIVLELRLPCLIGSLPLVCRQRTWACRQQQRCYTARNSLSASSIVFRRFWVLIRRLVQSLLANDDPYPNIQGLLITSSHQSRSMCRLLYPLTKCNCLKI